MALFPPWYYFYQPKFRTSSFLPLLLICISIFPTHLLSFAQPFASPFPRLNYTMVRTWDNKSTPDNCQIHLSFQLVESYPLNGRGLLMTVDAPYYNDPAISDKVPTDLPTLGLWNYEVVEAFFLGSQQNYLEIELGPKGHYLLLFFNGRDNLVSYQLPLTNYTASFSSVAGRWLGQAFIPADYFPCRVAKFNSYAIHKSEPNKVHMALFPVQPGQQYQTPDFHLLETFQDIEFGQEINTACFKQEQKQRLREY